MSIHIGTLYILASFIHFIFPPCAKSLAQELEREAREAKLTNRTTYQAAEEGVIELERRQARQHQEE